MPVWLAVKIKGAHLGAFIVLFDISLSLFFPSTPNQLGLKGRTNSLVSRPCYDCLSNLPALSYRPYNPLLSPASWHIKYSKHTHTYTRRGGTGKYAHTHERACSCKSVEAAKCACIESRSLLFCYVPCQYPSLLLRPSMIDIDFICHIRQRAISSKSLPSPLGMWSGDLPRRGWTALVWAGLGEPFISYCVTQFSFFY